MKKVRQSSDVFSLGLFILLLAFAWSLIEGTIFGDWSYRAANFLVERRGGRVVQMQVETDDGNTITVPSRDEFVQPTDPMRINYNDGFSFKSDVLGIYGSIDWGKTVRILMYLAGFGLLLLSMVKKPI